MTILNRIRFVHLLSLITVLCSGAGGILVLTGNFSPELKGSVVSLMLIGGYTSVMNFWIGSSSGSEKKTDVITNLTAANQPTQEVKP